MAHSDIFLCGKSSDAMLATGVSYIIKEKKEGVFFPKQLNIKGNILELVTHSDSRAAKNNGLCLQ